MRRVTIPVAVVMVLVALGAGAVLAQDQIIRCHAAPCFGSGNDDLIYERPTNGLNDRTLMRGGDDRVLAQRFTNDRDFAGGGTGFDRINVADGDRRGTASGRGRVVCIVDARSEAGRGCCRVIVR